MEHFLLDCSELQHERDKHGISQRVREENRERILCKMLAFGENEEEVDYLWSMEVIGEMWRMRQEKSDNTNEELTS